MWFVMGDHGHPYGGQVYAKFVEGWVGGGKEIRGPYEGGVYVCVGGKGASAKVSC